MSWKQGIQQTMKNLDIPIEATQDRDSYRAIISGRRNLLSFSLEKNLCGDEN